MRQKLQSENERIIASIRRAHNEIEEANRLFNELTDDTAVDYAAYNRIINHDFVQKIEIGNLRFTDCVEFDIVSKSADAAAVHEQLNGLTNGKIRLIDERNVRYRLRKE